MNSTLDDTEVLGFPHTTECLGVGGGTAWSQRLEDSFNDAPLKLGGVVLPRLVSGSSIGRV